MMNKISCFAAIIVSLVGITACEENLGMEPTSRQEENLVTFPVSLGFSDEENGFGTQPVPAAQTRTAPLTKPDALYELRILQYDSGGALKKSQSFSGATSIGTKLTLTLTAMEDCQLVVIACGQGNGSFNFGNSLSDVRKLTLSKEYFDAIPTDGSTAAGTNINKMPYILHLPHVKVTSAGIQSVEGAHDARLLLKRLAAKMTIAWNNNLTDNGYTLKEVRLCQVPVAFRLLPDPTQTEWGMTYPSAISEFIDYFRLTTNEELAAGSKTVWIPANARGISAAASSAYYRTKENAPEAASYAELVMDNSVKKERLYYRAYLGGDAPTDFNLLENTDYAWTLKINSTNYRNDARIQLLDQTPVISTNLVPSSNCFMMLPGTNICFNPYKHEAGTDGWNTELVSGGSILSDKEITSVKVLWQTKDAGTSGELVMGYVVDDDNHQNLVNVSDISDKDNALVHVKVPVTNGGNAVIAAYNSSGVIVWSWHIWVSDYIPVPLTGDISASNRAAAIETAQGATQDGMVQVYGGISWTDPSGAFYKCVIMDRNLGATKAGIQDNLLDRVRTFGLLYQGGRKDPFFSTADGTNKETKTIYDGDGNQTGITKIGRQDVPYQTLIQNPTTFYCCYYNNTSETLYSDKIDTWGVNGKKAIYDPCPVGWKVPTNDYIGKRNNALYSLFAGFGSTANNTVYEDAFGNGDNIYYFNGSVLASMKGGGGGSTSGTDIPGSGFLYIGGSGETMSDYSNKSAFFPGVALREIKDGAYRSSTKNNAVFLWASSMNAGAIYANARYIYQIQDGKFSFRHTISSGFGFSVRCVQDNEQ